MKYENFVKAKELCDQISKIKYTLAQLDNDIHVVIERPSSGRVYTIGISKNCEHEYTSHASKLVVDIRNDLEKRIESLKHQLESL